MTHTLSSTWASVGAPVSKKTRILKQQNTPNFTPLKVSPNSGVQFWEGPAARAGSLKDAEYADSGRDSVKVATPAGCGELDRPRPFRQTLPKAPLGPAQNGRKSVCQRVY